MPTLDYQNESKRAVAETRPRAMLAMVITGIVIVTVPIMVGLIGYRSVTIHTPETAVVVTGDASVDGAVIIHQSRGRLAKPDPSRSRSLPYHGDPS
jgi:hypothetical protein